MMVLLGLLSIPYIIVAPLPGGTIILPAYILGSAAAVWFVFIPKAAQHIQKEIPDLWHTMRTSSP